MSPLPQLHEGIRSDPGTAPRHLAFVTSTPYEVSGGSGTYVGIRELVRALDRQGVRVSRFTPGFWSPSYTLKRVTWNFAVARRLRRLAVDWVIGFDLDGFHYGRRPGAPYVASIKGVIADELKNERGVVRQLLALQAGFERLAVRRARVVVATSRYSQGRIVEAYGVPARKIVIVPELIDLDAWGTPPERPTDGIPAVLTVAHLYPRKNVGTLLRAYALLADEGLPFRGWVVGDGPCRREWERLARRLGVDERVQFLGTVSRAELADRYRRAAVFCLPSRQEGFGIVFLEAMAHGVPIVAGRAGAVPETVPDGEVGLLADPDDPRALAACLREVLVHADLRQALGRAGRRRVERFRSAAVAQEFLAAVQGALDTRAGCSA